MSVEIVNDAPQNCPGPESENRGTADACQGCPSQEYCKSTPKVDPDLPIIKERLSTIDKKILVLSGKGGVGKSTISSQLSFYLSSFEENEVGLLDIDICGPSIPRIMGLEGREILSRSNLGWEPVYLDDNLAVMSIGFLLGNSDDAIIWRGPKKNGAIKQFLKDVHWSALDYLVVDTPPGTSDEHLSIVTYLKDSKIDGAVIVTTPQEVSLSDVRKEINFCKKLKIPIIGVIENMSGFVCPKCKNGTQIFYPTTGGASKMCEEMEVPYLGSIPLDPFIAKNCDEGKSFIEQCPDSLASKSYVEIFEKVVDFIKKCE